MRERCVHLLTGASTATCSICEFSFLYFSRPRRFYFSEHVFFLFPPISVASRSAPLRPVTTFPLQIYTVLKLRAKALLSSEKVWSNAVVLDPSLSPILWFSANIIHTHSVSCHVWRIILLRECKFSLSYVCNLLKLCGGVVLLFFFCS